MKKLLLILFCSLLPLFAQTITHLRIEGAIGPASSAYVKSAFAFAQENNSSAVVISLDTPGGLASSMREIIQDILNSPRPIIIYVSPSGAQAASAGTYILYAAHICAMAPGTNLGAATPVSMITPANIDQNLSSQAMEKKVINDSTAYIISLAQLRDRNVTWAEEAVKEGKSTSAQDALRYGVIDLIAASEKELLEKLEGREVQISDKSVILSFKEAEHLYYEPDWKQRFLSIITDPNIAYILLMLGVYGIFFELMNPGSIYPGIIGLISGVMALYALNLLPFSYAGLLLIAIGIALMITEIFVSGFGIFGIAGTVSFALGSVLLFDADTLGEGVSLPLIIAFSISSLAFFLLLLRFVFSSHSARIVSGAEEMISLPAEVIQKEGEFYRVRCHGEIWSATSEAELRVGDIAYVDAVNNLTLILRSKP